MPKRPSPEREIRPTTAKIQVRSWHCTSPPTSAAPLQCPHSMAPSCLHLDSRIVSWLQHQFQNTLNQRNPSVTWAHHLGLLPSLLSCRGFILGVRADNSGKMNLLPSIFHSLQCFIALMCHGAYCSHLPLWLLQMQRSPQPSSPFSCLCFTLLLLFLHKIEEFLPPAFYLFLQETILLLIILSWIFHLSSSVSLLLWFKNRCWLPNSVSRTPVFNKFIPLPDLLLSTALQLLALSHFLQTTFSLITDNFL